MSANANDVHIGSGSSCKGLGVYGSVSVVKCVNVSENVVASGNVTGTILCGTSCVCTVGVHCSSDERLKKDITNYRPIGGLACSVMSLRAVEYKWKDPAKSQKCNIGFIAQEVEKVIPSAVSCAPEISDGLKNKRAIDHGPILATLLELSKEHQIKIENLEKEVENLKKLV